MYESLIYLPFIDRLLLSFKYEFDLGTKLGVNLNIIILDIIHRPVLYLKTTFWRLNFVFVFRRGCAQLSRYHLRTEAKSNLPNILFQIKDRRIDNVRNCNSYINISSLQTYRSVLIKNIYLTSPEVGDSNTTNSNNSQYIMTQLTCCACDIRICGF
jgi:hypothetical protein